MSNREEPELSAEQEAARLVSLKTLAELLDADRSTVRRWLADAGIAPGRGGAWAPRGDPLSMA